MNTNANAGTRRTVYTTDVLDRVRTSFRANPNRFYEYEDSITDEIKAVAMIAIGGTKVVFETDWVHVYNGDTLVDIWSDRKIPDAFPKIDGQVAENFLKRHGCIWVRTPYLDKDNVFHVLAPPDRFEELRVEAVRRGELYRLWDDLKDRFDKQEIGRLIADEEEYFEGYFDALLSAEREVTALDLVRLRQQA